MPAFVCRVTENNLSAITSEAGRRLTKEVVQQWMTDHEEGYFLRDEGSPFDCELFEPEVLFTIYQYDDGDTNALFRRVVKIREGT